MKFYCFSIIQSFSWTLTPFRQKFLVIFRRLHQYKYIFILSLNFEMDLKSVLLSASFLFFTLFLLIAIVVIPAFYFSVTCQRPNFLFIVWILHKLIFFFFSFFHQLPQSTTNRKSWTHFHDVQTEISNLPKAVPGMQRWQC